MLSVSEFVKNVEQSRESTSYGDPYSEKKRERKFVFGFKIRRTANLYSSSYLYISKQPKQQAAFIPVYENALSKNYIEK